MISVEFSSYYKSYGRSKLNYKENIKRKKKENKRRNKKITHFGNYLPYFISSDFLFWFLKAFFDFDFILCGVEL